MNKYGAKATYVDGVRFDSRMEARRYQELKLLEHAGAIRELVLQPAFVLAVNGQKIGEYRADFAYTDTTTGEHVVEDVKSTATRKIPLYRWKKRHFECQYGHPITEVTT